MKALIVPIVIVAGLIVLSVIVDRKDFIRHNDVQTTEKQKSPETQSVMTEHTETNSLAKTRSTSAPFAVPVFTEEEAKRKSDFSVFLASVKTTTVEGEVTERSVLPDPKKSDYPNCRFTAHFNGNSIKTGEPCPKEISLVMEGFEDYRILPNNNIKAGDKVQCTIIPFEELPEDYQSTQQADDLELFLLESYYVLEIKKIKEFTDNELLPASGLYFSDGNEDYISLFDRHINPPLSDRIKAEQMLSVKTDQERMAFFLDGIDDDVIRSTNKSFAAAWQIEKAKDPPGYNRVRNHVWRNMENSFWTLPVRSSGILSKPDQMSQQMLDSFLSLKNVLEANGVQLIVSLVPTMNVISARVINREFREIPDIQTATYVKQLSEIGVETIYASDQIIKNYNRFPFAYFIPENPHPSDTVQDVLADLLAERLSRYGIKPELDPALFSDVQSPHMYKEKQEYRFPSNCDIGQNQTGQSYKCRDILYHGEKVTRSKDSSVMVIGNSFMETPISSPESLPVLLSYKLRSPVDWHRVSGYGPFSDILIQLLSNPDFYLKNKKVLIIQVGTMHITTVNRAETMLDIAKLDSERLLLNNRKMKGHLLLKSNASVEEVTDSELWGPLSAVEKTVLKIGETGELTYSFRIEQIGNDVADSEPSVCIIPHTCVRNTTCKITVNGMGKTMHCPNYAENSRFFNLAYELPAGTKIIDVKIEGTPGTILAIKDVQIWQ